MKMSIQTIVIYFLLNSIFHTQVIAQYALKTSAFGNAGALITNGSTINVNSVGGHALSGASANGTNQLGSGFIAAAWSSVTNDNTLPVELLSFTVSAPGDSVLLIEFSTASEVNIAGYNILRSGSEQGSYRVIASYNEYDELLSPGNSAFGRDYTWKDKTAIPETDYWYKLQNMDLDGSSETFGPVYARFKGLPQKYALSQNYPNPFNPKTNIEYTVRAQHAAPVHVELSIYNLLGQKVATLVNKEQQADKYSIKWDAGNFASGIYFYVLTAGDFKMTRKLVLLK